MKRSITWVLLVVLALLCASCGGGASSSVPDGNNGGGDNNGGKDSVYSLVGPSSVSGGHSVSEVPGMVNVRTSAKGAALEALASRHGYSLVSSSNGFATLQLPSGVSTEQAKAVLEKEYNVTSVEPLRRIQTPSMRYGGSDVRRSSFVPGDPFYSEQFVEFLFDPNAQGGPFIGFSSFFGQGLPMTVQGFNGAWDIAHVNGAVSAEPVTIAIIDAGWLDYSVVNRSGFDETLINPLSAAVDGAGTATTGLSAIAWELDDDADPTTRDFPFRGTGEYLLGMLGASLNDFNINAFDFDSSTALTEDEIWNEGMAGVNPNANYLLIKTGTLVGQNWTFSDNELAESLDYAVANGADIVLFGMFGTGTVSANLSTAIQNARDNNVLVIAPAGDVTDTFDGGTGTFTGTPVDITVTSVSPASDPNVVSVTATGVNRVSTGELGTVDIDPAGPGPEDLPNIGTGYLPLFGDPVSESIREIAAYNNTGATIAGVGYGIGFGFSPFLVSGAGTIADPVVGIPAEEYRTLISNFGTTAAAAYVAGAASQVFQILSNVNGTPPTDDEVLAELLNTVQFAGMVGVAGSGPGTGGLLNAGAAATSAINGGNLNTILPAMAITNLQVSQPFAAVTRGTDFDVTVNVSNGTAPFTTVVDWDNGGDPPNITTVDPWTNGDPVSLAGGYDTLGFKIVNVEVTDADGRIANASFQIHVINPLSASITIEDTNAAVLQPAAGVYNLVTSATANYRFRANAANVYTGDVGGTPNTTTFSWDFNGDSVEDATGPSPATNFATATPGTNTITCTLTVSEAVRPDQTFTVTINVD
ncbi:hypothetical protein IT575_14480 [bacterium]|nr:hypothetical protein [bacterium]